jgi:hypothetical protein
LSRKDGIALEKALAALELNTDMFFTQPHCTEVVMWACSTVYHDDRTIKNSNGIKLSDVRAAFQEEMNKTIPNFYLAMRY